MQKRQKRGRKSRCFCRFENAVEIDISLADDSHLLSECTVLKVYNGNSAVQTLDVIRRIGATDLNPIGIESEAHKIGGHSLRHKLHDGLASDLFEFCRVVVVHKVFALALQDLAGLGVGFKEERNVILSALANVVEPAKTDVITAEDGMVAGNLKRVLFDPFGRNVGKNAFKSESVELGLHFMRIIFAYAR